MKKYSKTKNSKRFSILDRFRYHYKRAHSPKKYGVKYGSPKQCYSDGFSEAFYGRNNESGIRGEFGKKCGNAYAYGYKRGRKAAFEYSKQTGKNPDNIYIYL